MVNIELTIIILRLISFLCFGVSISSLVVWPAYQRDKANKLVKFKLESISKYDGYIIDKECLLDNASLNDRNEAIKREIVKIIKPILETIEDYVGEENTRLMYTNLKTVDIVPLKKSLTREGDYNFVLNRIRFKNVSALIHELLHLSSSYYDKEKNIAEIGFSQVDDEKVAEIGRGLNEGYTELLASRIIEDKPKATIWLVEIAKLFELFFDNPKDMENLYFRHDLPGFIHYMEEFIPNDKLMDIIIRLDRINTFYDKQVPVFIYLEAINIEKELYGYFVKSNRNLDKLTAFEEVLREKMLSSVAFSREINQEIKDDFDAGRKKSA